MKMRKPIETYRNWEASYRVPTTGHSQALPRAPWLLSRGWWAPGCCSPGGLRAVARRNGSSIHCSLPKQQHALLTTQTNRGWLRPGWRAATLSGAGWCTVTRSGASRPSWPPANCPLTGQGPRAGVSATPHHRWARLTVNRGGTPQLKQQPNRKCVQCAPDKAPRLVSPYTSSVDTQMKRRMRRYTRHASSSTCVPYLRWAGGRSGRG